MWAEPSPTSFSATWRRGALAIHKVSTTPDDPSRGVMTGIRELCAENGVDPGEIHYVFHGTTTATNAVLENKGARAGMITNEGFRDIIHIAPPPARRALFDHAGTALAEPAAGQAPLPQDGAGPPACRRPARSWMPLDEAAVRQRRDGAARRRASNRSPSASSSPTSTRRTRTAPRRSSKR